MNDRPILTRPSGITAEQVLYVLNGCQTVDLKELEVCVIVAEHAPADGEPEPWPFRLGEILLLNLARMRYPSEIQPEFLGAGRDISQWDARRCVKWFNSDFESAWLLSRQLAEGMAAGMYELSDGRYYRLSDQEYAYDRWCSDPDGYVRVGMWAP